MQTKSLLHPRHNNEPGERTIGGDGMSLREAIERAKANPKHYQEPVFSPEDLTEFIIACGEPMGPMQIAAGLQCSPNTVAAPLFRAVNMGLLERSGRGGFTVYHPTPEAMEKFPNA